MTPRQVIVFFLAVLAGIIFIAALVADGGKVFNSDVSDVLAVGGLLLAVGLFVEALP